MPVISSTSEVVSAYTLHMNTSAASWTVHGMLKCIFTSMNKIKYVEFYFDNISFFQEYLVRDPFTASTLINIDQRCTRLLPDQLCIPHYYNDAIAESPQVRAVCVGCLIGCRLGL